MNVFEKRPLLVQKRWLHFTAGLMWTAVGFLLWSFAYRWVKPLPAASSFFLVSMGILLASLIYALGFSKLAENNINRIKNLSGKKHTLFHFQNWTSYPLILVMVSLGIHLRKYSPIPKPALGSLYIGIGGGLLFSSIHYYIHLWKKLSGESSKQ